MTAILLITASQVSKKSLWLNVRHHIIRDLYDQKIITMTDGSAARMRIRTRVCYFSSAEGCQ